MSLEGQSTYVTFLPRRFPRPLFPPSAAEEEDPPLEPFAPAAAGSAASRRARRARSDAKLMTSTPFGATPMAEATAAANRASTEGVSAAFACAAVI